MIADLSGDIIVINQSLSLSLSLSLSIYIYIYILSLYIYIISNLIYLAEFIGIDQGLFHTQYNISISTTANNYIKYLEQFSMKFIFECTHAYSKVSFTRRVYHLQCEGLCYLELNPIFFDEFIKKSSYKYHNMNWILYAKGILITYMNILYCQRRLLIESRWLVYRYVCNYSSMP